MPKANPPFVALMLFHSFLKANKRTFLSAICLIETSSDIKSILNHLHIFIYYSIRIQNVTEEERNVPLKKFRKEFGEKLCKGMSEEQELAPLAAKTSIRVSYRFTGEE
jgi:hypothetical protein